MFSDLQIREAFHFCFLERLLKLSDIRLYVLKGGVNLRFYFRSPRYSEDMDVDVLGGGVQTLRKNGYKILEDPAFKRSLKVFDIDAIEVNDPKRAKHTATTQRFRCTLVRASGQRLPTRVEFSRRAADPEAGAVVERIDPEIARPYRRLAYLCRHYSATAAVAQKIAALAGRATTQARDVFDLGVLVRGGHFAAAARDGALTGAPLSRAIECLMTLTREDYEGQVVNFLSADSSDEYAGAAAWDALRNEVFEALAAHA